MTSIQEQQLESYQNSMEKYVSDVVKEYKQLTYLAVPYSHEDKDVMETRFEIVCEVAGKLMNQGKMIFSPISHSHPIAVRSKLPRSWEFWEKFDRAYLMCSKELYVLMLDGWEESTGVTAEIKMAKELNIPIFYKHLLDVL